MHPLDPAIHARLRESAARDEMESYRDAVRIAPELLPLYLDWVGFIGLSSRDEFLFVPWDPPHLAERLQDPHMIRIALVAAVEHYAALAALRPERPSNAVVCTICRGSGRATVSGKPAPDNIRCFCGGIGWLLPGEAERASRP